MKKKPIVIKTKIQIWKNPHNITPGTLIDVNIQIVDEIEIITTSNHYLTKDLAKVAPIGTTALYSERFKRTLVRYPGKTQLEIYKLVMADLSQLKK